MNAQCLRVTDAIDVETGNHGPELVLERRSFGLVPFPKVKQHARRYLVEPGRDNHIDGQARHELFDLSVVQRRALDLVVEQRFRKAIHRRVPDPDVAESIIADGFRPVSDGHRIGQRSHVHSRQPWMHANPTRISASTSFGQAGGFQIIDEATIDLRAEDVGKLRVTEVYGSGVDRRRVVRPVLR
jgi:hypothetical protein